MVQFTTILLLILLIIVFVVVWRVFKSVLKALFSVVGITLVGLVIIALIMFMDYQSFSNQQDIVVGFDEINDTDAFVIIMNPEFLTQNVSITVDSLRVNLSEEEISQAINARDKEEFIDVISTDNTHRALLELSIREEDIQTVKNTIAVAAFREKMKQISTKEFFLAIKEEDIQTNPALTSTSIVRAIPQRLLE